VSALGEESRWNWVLIDKANQKLRKKLKSRRRAFSHRRLRPHVDGSAEILHRKSTPYHPATIGLVEPPAVIQDSRDADSYLLLDGHLRIEVLRDLGQTEVECLVSTDDEAFTYNKRISRLSPVQEQRMIAKAIERNVPRDKIARALDINVRSVARKVQLLDGTCHEAIGLLKDKICPMAVFDVLRKMSPLRQIEAAELLINANNFSVSYASAILAGTPQAQLATPQTPKRLKGT
jgi:hypothetical protein